MLLQGDLQKVFDALFHMGVIEPVLEMDWRQEYEKIEENPAILRELVSVVNETDGNYVELISELRAYEVQDLSYLAMLVAKELVGFHTNETLH